ncbi:MAG: hypothetical protein B6I30_06120 [Desulfobacteraceae bacterium 4572_187]|nr:MAG: hypothetical protein B6I30_06120 [Desulfobacteraceae bacterium 4572_187]
MENKTWFEKNPKKTYAMLFAFFFVLLEIFLRVLVSYNVIPYERYPTSSNPVFWDNIDPVVGVWKYSNSSLHHESACFDVVYESNSYGARDIERNRHSMGKQRTVVLGDSYAEGFGVQSENRITDLLEERTGIEHLNFGTSGSFGSVQEWLLYEHKASKFDHTDVFIFMLPFNDFSDNNPNDFSKDHYRPYVKKVNGKFEVYYTTDFVKKEKAVKKEKNFRATPEIIKNTIDNTFYTANFLRWATREIKKGLGLKKKKISENIVPPYDKFSEGDLEILLYTYRKIGRVANGRNVYIFTIPAEVDFYVAQKRGYDFKLVRELKKFVSQYDNMFFKDLLPGFLRHAQKNNLEYDDYTLGCNGHWGNLGHKVAAGIVFDAVYK